MKVAEILSILNQIAPFELQEDWDNSGLLIGDENNEISKIYLCLDVQKDLVEEAKENSLFIAHHPLIFKPLSFINPTKYPGNIIYEIIKKNISFIALHTNADKAFLNEYVAKNILGYKIIQKRDFLIDFEVQKSFDEFFEDVKQKLNLKTKRVVKTKDFIKNATICTGSGSSFIKDIKTECFLTGDIKYHEAFEAKENDLCLIDIEHFNSEIFFTNALKKLLKTKGINAIIAPNTNPFIN